MNRACFGVGLAFMLATFVAMDLFFGVRTPPGGALGILLGCCVPRLHDLGRSGWWFLGLVPIQFAATGLTLKFIEAPVGLVVGHYASTILTLGLLVWLGCIQGQPSANRFGAPPVRGLRGWTGVGDRPRKVAR